MVRIQGFHCLGLGSISGQGTESHKMCGEAKKKKKKDTVKKSVFGASLVVQYLRLHFQSRGSRFDPWSEN